MRDNLKSLRGRAAWRSGKLAKEWDIDMGKTGKNARRPQPTRARRELIQSVQKMADLFQEKLKGTDAKASVSDWIRLLTLHQQLAEDDPKDITVRWVDNLEEKELKD